MNNTTFYLLFCNVCIAIRLLNRTDDFMLMCYTNIYMSNRRMNMPWRQRERMGAMHENTTTTAAAAAVETFIKCSQRSAYVLCIYAVHQYTKYRLQID